jgi:hypothetical protein
VVMGGEMIRSLDAPRLRVVLRDALARPEEETPEPESASSASSAAEAGTR